MTLYHGGCQCGAVQYDVELSLENTVCCNCSRCRRLGSVLAFAPATAFTLLSGEGAQTEFLFNAHKIHHLFCKACGIQSYSQGQMPDGTPAVAVNVNCLDGVDARALSPTAYDGASR